MSGKTRRAFSAPQKTALVRRRLVGKVPVSDLPEEHGPHPSVFSERDRQARQAAWRSAKTPSNESRFN